MNVSIIMPVYNGGAILDLTIPPLLKQNYNKGNIEIIIINDASTDNSLQIIKKYYSNNNISIISNKNNKGRSYTRNKGIQNSSGQILIFVDCDIEVDQNFVSNHVKKHLDDNNDKAMEITLKKFKKWRSKLNKDNTELVAVVGGNEVGNLMLMDDFFSKLEIFEGDDDTEPLTK